MEDGEDRSDLPATASRKIIGFIGVLWHQSTRPSLDIRTVLHIIIVNQDIDVFDQNIDDGRIFQLLHRSLYGRLPIAKSVSLNPLHTF